jgi:hypothetical protein
MIDDGDCGATGTMEIGRVNRSTRRKPPQCYFVHHKSHMNWPGLEPCRRVGNPATNGLSYDTGCNSPQKPQLGSPVAEFGPCSLVVTAVWVQPLLYTTPGRSLGLLEPALLHVRTRKMVAICILSPSVKQFWLVQLDRHPSQILALAVELPWSDSTIVLAQIFPGYICGHLVSPATREHAIMEDKISARSVLGLYNED